MITLTFTGPRRKSLFPKAARPAAPCATYCYHAFCCLWEVGFAQVIGVAKNHATNGTTIAAATRVASSTSPAPISAPRSGRPRRVAMNIQIPIQIASVTEEVAMIDGDPKIVDRVNRKRKNVAKKQNQTGIPKTRLDATPIRPGT